MNVFRIKSNPAGEEKVLYFSAFDANDALAQYCHVTGTNSADVLSVQKFADGYFIADRRAEK